ncbi:hypothetical protein ACSHWB_27910 [Lentzea sp. HUAS TT2]|uniref:hypothetical protein n=1 Tax=Lentzea sp. HUAS TT2 TaxID=3447454 RepID=UPI003F713B54
MEIHALSGMDQGPEFHAAVDAIAAVLPKPRYPHLPVFLDDLPDSSARLDLMRLAVLVALERVGKSVHPVPVTGHSGRLPDHGWLISREEPSPGLTFLQGETQPHERIATVAEGSDGAVRVTVGGTRFEFQPPPEEQCRWLLNAGARGAALRFPVMPSPGPFLLARGNEPDELVLWRLGLPTAWLRLPGPVLAATYVSASHLNALIALIEVDGELLVHVTGDGDTDLVKLRIPIDFSVADEAAHDLSPLYLHSVEPWDVRVYFRRAGQWWTLRWSPGHVLLEPSNSKLHQPDIFPFHTKLDGAGMGLRGPGYTYAWDRGGAWEATGTDWEDTLIPVPPGEDVLQLVEIAGGPALLTREGDVVRARTREAAHTVTDFAGPLVPHHQLPWVAVQRSPHLVEILDVATGAVLHRLDTA